jgi:hypothetical protein
VLLGRLAVGEVAGDAPHPELDDVAVGSVPNAARVGRPGDWNPGHTGSNAAPGQRFQERWRLATGVRSGHVVEPTYFVQISDPEEPEHWHTVARVEGKELADEVVRLAQGSYMRTTVMAESHYLARAVSQSALRRDKRLAHAQWELGMGEHRHYCRALVEKARQNLVAR